MLERDISILLGGSSPCIVQWAWGSFNTLGLNFPTCLFALLTERIVPSHLQESTWKAQQSKWILKDYKPDTLFNDVCDTTCDVNSKRLRVMMSSLGPVRQGPWSFEDDKAGSLVHQNPSAASSCQMQLVLCSFTDTLFCTFISRAAWTVWFTQHPHTFQLNVSRPVCPIPHCGILLPCHRFSGASLLGTDWLHTAAICFSSLSQRLFGNSQAPRCSHNVFFLNRSFCFLVNC